MTPPRLSRLEFLSSYVSSLCLRAPNSHFIDTCAAFFSGSVVPALSNLLDNRVSQPSARSDAATVPLVSQKGDINMHVRHMYM